MLGRVYRTLSANIQSSAVVSNFMMIGACMQKQEAVNHDSWPSPDGSQDTVITKSRGGGAAGDDGARGLSWQRLLRMAEKRGALVYLAQRTSVGHALGEAVGHALRFLRERCEVGLSDAASVTDLAREAALPPLAMLLAAGICGLVPEEDMLEGRLVQAVPKLRPYAEIGVQDIICCVVSVNASEQWRQRLATVCEAQWPRGQEWCSFVLPVTPYADGVMCVRMSVQVVGNPRADFQPVDVCLMLDRKLPVRAQGSAPHLILQKVRSVSAGAAFVKLIQENDDERADQQEIANRAGLDTVLVPEIQDVTGEQVLRLLIEGALAARRARELTLADLGNRPAEPDPVRPRPTEPKPPSTAFMFGEAKRKAVAEHEDRMQKHEADVRAWNEECLGYETAMRPVQEWDGVFTTHTSRDRLPMFALAHSLARLYECLPQSEPGGSATATVAPVTALPPAYAPAISAAAPPAAAPAPSAPAPVAPAAFTSQDSGSLPQASLVSQVNGGDDWVGADSAERAPGDASDGIPGNDGDGDSDGEEHNRGNDVADVNPKGP